MAPDLLIIGERLEREDLSRRVDDFGYQSATASPGELARHLGNHPPAAILLCARGCDVPELLHTLREDPQGIGIPVVLHSELGGAIRDLADVLELGADRFLVAPVDDSELRETLLELLGPSEPTTPSQVDLGTGSDLPLRQRDPLLAQLRRTLAALDRRNDTAASDSGGFDLDTIGLGGGPGLESERESDDIDSDGLSMINVEPATERVIRHPPQARQRPHRAATLRLADRHQTPPPELTDKTTKVSRRHKKGSKRQVISRGDAAISTHESSQIGDQRPSETPPRQPSEESDLQLSPLPQLLMRLQSERFSGMLRICGPRTIEIDWSDGIPVQARSDRPEDRLSAALLRRGLIDQASAQELQRRLPSDTIDNIDAAIELGAIKISERSLVLDEQIAEMLTAGFTWRGSWSLHPGSAPQRTTRPPLHRPLAAIICEGILLEFEEPTLRHRLGDGELRPKIRPGCDLNDLDPPTEAAVLTEPLDARLSIDELAALGGRPLLAWIYALQVLGRIDLVDGSGAIKTVDPTAGDKSKSQSDREEEKKGSIDRQRLGAALERARSGDYFDLLGLPQSASRGELRRAHHRLRQTFADEHLEASTLKTMAAELQELRAAVDEARDVLLDDALRAAYLAYREG
ncbi:MAG TPA: hypothetical protein ENJ18_11910 [Nannocystis exedens]|nr:hypothetical protein [Nannocystis exedens]